MNFAMKISSVSIDHILKDLSPEESILNKNQHQKKFLKKQMSLLKNGVELAFSSRNMWLFRLPQLQK